MHGVLGGSLGFGLASWHNQIVTSAKLQQGGKRGKIGDLVRCKVLSRALGTVKGIRCPLLISKVSTAAQGSSCPGDLLT